MGPAGRGGSGTGHSMFYPNSWLPGFFPAFEPASPCWCCELPDSLLLLFKLSTTSFSHFQWRVLTCGVCCELCPWEAFSTCDVAQWFFPWRGWKIQIPEPWRFWSSKSWESFGLDGSSSWKSHSLGPASSSVQGTKRQCLRKWARGMSITPLNCLSQNPSQLVNLIYENSLRHRESLKYYV